MVHYKLLVVHWSIFTLSVQLIYCASLHSIRDSSMTSAGGVGLSAITDPPTYKSSQTVSRQSICHAETEHMLSINGKESSIMLDLEPNRIQMGPCKRTFIAPEPHGFIVKLLKYKSKQMRNPNSHIYSDNAGGVSVDVYNETTTCPLNIMTGKDPLTPPWKLDPCKMEAHGTNKEIVRLTEGLLRISWTPNHHSPKYKLIITTLGKGYHCNQGKHPCLKFGQETLFCVSSSLVCDGIAHCPSGDEYNSDEDVNLCGRQRNAAETNTSFGLSIWQQISKEFFSKLYPPETETSTTTMTTATPATSSSKSPKVLHKNSGNDEGSSESDDADDDSTETTTTTKQHRHITLTRGISKYGPWGYLILGMLLCGGALLVCVLWECCCKSDKTPFITTLDSSNVSTITGSSTNSNFNAQSSETTMPPNYDEIDPPPSYSTLFPGNKSFESQTSGSNENESVMPTSGSSSSSTSGSSNNSNNTIESSANSQSPSTVTVHSDRNNAQASAPPQQQSPD